MSGQVVGAAVAVFIGLILFAGPYFRSFDEAKYLGVGYSMLAGDGPRTVFGAVFTPHSPLWPILLAAPDVWFGIDPFAWGQFLNVIAGVGVLLLVGWFGARIRPLVGALAVVAYLATPYLQDLTRTARLDVPVAFLVLGYLAVGMDAVRRDSIPRAIAAGVLVAIAFLVKEIALPVAPVPFLFAILIGRPFAAIARLAAATALVAAVATAWWFVLFASYTHQVYRLGASDRLLVPLYAVVAILVAVGLAAPWLASRPAARRAPARIGRVVPSSVAPRSRQILAWGLAASWFAAFVIFFDRNSELKSVGLVSMGQYRLYLDTWLPSAGLPLIGAIGLGVFAAFVVRQRLGRDAAAWFDGIVLSLVCSAPLVMLVIAVGEPPRNYLAEIGLLLVLAATGWIGAAIALARQRRSAGLAVGLAVAGAVVLGYLAGASGTVPTVVGVVAGAALGLVVAWRWSPSDWGPIDPERPATGTARPAAHETSGARTASGRLGLGLVGLLIVALVVSSTALAVSAVRTRQRPPGSAEGQAVHATAAWIEANIPAGAKIGFGSYLGYETAVDLAGRNPLVQIRQALAVVDPTSPLGLARFNGPPVDDWLAVDTSRREREFYVFRARDFARSVRATKIAYYIHLTGPTTSVPALLAALRPEHGFTLLMSGSFESVNASGRRKVAGLSVFAVDPAKVDFTGAPVAMSPSALDRLTGLLADDPATTPATAAALRNRAVTYPDPAAAAAFLDRLRARAGA